MVCKSVLEFELVYTLLLGISGVQYKYLKAEVVISLETEVPPVVSGVTVGCIPKDLPQQGQNITPSGDKGLKGQGTVSYSRFNVQVL